VPKTSEGQVRFAALSQIAGKIEILRWRSFDECVHERRSYVKPYVKRGKNDEADAEAICEAVTRPTMQFVPVKSAERQSILMLHRTRDRICG
jgi:hypothetical protein